MKRGFTLVELLVSVAIFSVVMTMALGALLSLSVADRKAQTLKSAIDNLTFSVDSMTRAMRTGANYHCGVAGAVGTPQDCNATGDNYITFTQAGGTQVYYRLDTANASICGQTAGSVGCIERSADGATWYPITSPDIIIQNNGFLFHVVGAPTGDGLQPKVLITVSGVVQVTSAQQSTFRMQSSVTQRIYDQ
jgi:prepilin-type N-terminal cleavage/methylation domain-containing protein